MADLQTYYSSDFGNVRAIEINGQVYFVAKDITEVLGYANASKAIIDHVDEDDKLNNESLSSLGQRGGWLINESGLYSLVLSSKLPTAKRFKHWVTSEVLPAIRKKGSYSLPQTYKEALQQLLITIEENEKLVAANEEMQPKAEYFDELVDRKLNLSFRDTAKELGIKESILINKLLMKKYLFRDIDKNGKPGTLRPYATYSESGKGYFTMKEVTSRVSSWAGSQTLVTPKGRQVFKMLFTEVDDA